MTIFNPLDHVEVSESGDRNLASESKLINDQMGVCPKCKQPFESASVGDDQVFFCPPCRVTQPMQVACC